MRLEEKARINGLGVIKVNPANTSRVCAKYSIPSRLVRMEGKALIGLISLSKLFAWLSVVETSYLKPQKLLRWVNSDKYD